MARQRKDARNWSEPGAGPVRKGPWMKRHWILTPALTLGAGLLVGGMSGMTSSTATVAVPAAGLPQPTVTVTAAPVTVSAAPITISAAPVTVTAAPITVIETPAAAPSSRVAQFAPSQPEPEPEPETDPRFSSCKEALANGYGHYREGIDPEYDWYRDGDNDGIVCE